MGCGASKDPKIGINESRNSNGLKANKNGFRQVDLNYNANKVTDSKSKKIYISSFYFLQF
jgi:hypothetical protein